MDARAARVSNSPARLTIRRFMVTPFVGATSRRQDRSRRPPIPDAPSGYASAHPEAAPAGLVELLRLEAVGPLALVVLRREVARAVAVQERLADLRRVRLVARAPGSRR